MTLITFPFKVDGVLTDADSVILADPTETFGVRRVDSEATVVPSGTPMEHASLGTYTYEFEDPADGLMYEYYVTVEYDGDTYYVQGFREGGGGEVQTKELVFAVINKGELLALGEYDDPPVLANPQGTFGVKRISDGVVVIPAGTQLDEVGDGVFSKAFEELVNKAYRYRYYVKITIEDVDYCIPSVSSQEIIGSMLAISRYTDSYKVGQRFGHDNVHLWVGTLGGGAGEADNPPDYVQRLYEFLDEAEQRIDEALLGAFVSGPFEVTEDYTIPPIITRLATELAGVLMYEARGVDDVDPDTNEARHRLRHVKKEVESQLRRISMGLTKVTGSSSLSPIQQPVVGGACIKTDDEAAREVASQRYRESSSS